MSAFASRAVSFAVEWSLTTSLLGMAGIMRSLIFVLVDELLIRDAEDGVVRRFQPER